jgi:hypothetical protein
VLFGGAPLGQMVAALQSLPSDGNVGPLRPQSALTLPPNHPEEAVHAIEAVDGRTLAILRLPRLLIEPPPASEMLGWAHSLEQP